MLPADVLSRPWQQRVLQAPLSDTCRVGLAPGPAYTLLVADDHAQSLRRLAGRLVQTLLVLGVCVAIMATERVTPGLVMNLAGTWSFIVGIQLLTAFVLVSSAPQRPVSRLRALDLWFAAQLPYNLWLIALAIVVFFGGVHIHVFGLLTIVIPAAWTMAIAPAYCRVVLGTTAAGAVTRTCAHQGVTWAVVAAYVLLSAGGLTSVSAWLARRLT